MPMDVGHTALESMGKHRYAWFGDARQPATALSIRACDHCAIGPNTSCRYRVTAVHAHRKHSCQASRACRGVALDSRLQLAAQEQAAQYMQGKQINPEKC